MTEESQQSEITVQPDLSNTVSSKMRDSKKEKCRPMTKVVFFKKYFHFTLQYPYYYFSRNMQTNFFFPSIQTIITK